MAGKGTKNNQQNTQGDAQTEQAVQTKPLDFDVRIHSIKPKETSSNSSDKSLSAKRILSRSLPVMQISSAFVIIELIDIIVFAIIVISFD